MIRTSFIIVLVLTGLLSYSQKNNESLKELENIFLTIPDSVFEDNIFNFSSSDRHLFWQLYNGENYEKVKFNDDILGNADMMFRNDSIQIDAYVDINHKLLRIRNRKSDADPTCDLKVYDNKNSDFIAVSIRYYDFASNSPEVIVFYKIQNRDYIEITEEILNSFNYFTDNFDDTIINILNHYYSRDLRTEKLNEILLYSFTSSDTVYISKSFFDIPIKEHLDKDKHFDGEFYTKKYIMDNGKLRLAE